MAMNQTDLELRRKAQAGIMPTDPANMQRYNEIKSTLGNTTRQAPASSGGLLQGIGDVMKRAYDNYVTTRRTNTINQLSPNQRMDNIYSEIGNIRNQLNRPAQQFSYDPDDDPQYQAALRQARSNARTAAGDIAADMNKRGLLNSTITADRGNQAAQREYAYVSDTVLPQLMQQAYGRYVDQENRQRQAVLDQLGLLESQYGMATDADARNFRDTSYADQRADVAYNRENQERQQRLDLANYMSERYGTLVEPKMDTNLVYEQVRGLTPRDVLESDRSFERGVLESDRNFNRGVLESDRSYGLQAAQERRLASNQTLDNLYRQWETTGIAPAGIPGVQAGTPWSDGDQEIPTGSLTANQFLDSITSQYAEPVVDEYGNNLGSRVTTNPAQREEMFLQIVDAGYDDPTTRQLLISSGFTQKEIDRLLQKYGG